MPKKHEGASEQEQAGGEESRLNRDQLTQGCAGLSKHLPLTADKLGNHRDVPIRDRHDLPDFNRIIPALSVDRQTVGKAKDHGRSRKLQERGYSGPVAEVELVTSPQILNTSEDRAHGTADNEKASDSSQVFRPNNQKSRAPS